MIQTAPSTISKQLTRCSNSPFPSLDSEGNFKYLSNLERFQWFWQRGYARYPFQDIAAIVAYLIFITFKVAEGGTSKATLLGLNYLLSRTTNTSCKCMAVLARITDKFNVVGTF